MFQDILDKREMEVQDNLQSFYNDLKGTGVKGLPDDYNIFKSALSDPVNAKGFYEDLKGSGVVEGLPDSFEAFSTILPGNNYFTNTTVIDNPVSLENLQKGLTDFDEQNKGFFEEWKSYQKNLEEATKVHDPYKVSELLNYVRKNAEKYNNLSKERDQLIEGIYTHPELSEKRKAESERIDSSMKDIDTFVESIDNRNALRFVSGVNPIYLSDGEREQAREIRRLDEAKKIYKDTKEMLQAPSKYDKSNGFLNFLKGGGDTFNNRDFWSAGMTQIARNLDIRDILEKVNKNRDGKDIENFLTKGEQSLLDAFLTQTTVQSERANDLSGGYMAGQSAAQSVDFMAEFLATGGLAAAASGAAKKAVMRWIIKHTPSSSLRREMAKGVAWMTESGLGTLARTPVMPSTYRSVTDELLQYKTDNEGNVLLDENNQPILKSGWESFRDGFTDSLIENVSELSAEHIAGTLGVLGKATHKVLPKNIQSMFKKTGDSIASWKPVELYSNFSKTPVYKFLKETGFNGFVPEMAEEWYGNGLRAMLGDTAALKDFATVENQLITAAAFLPMSLIGGSVSAVQMVRTKGRYENSLKTLQDVLSDLGYKQDQVDYFIDQVNASSAREMAKTITPIINRIAMENEEKGKEVFKAVSDFVYAKGSYHMLNGAYTEQMGERKKAEDERLMKETGGYVNSATDKVQIVTDKEGNRAFLVGESIDADHKVYVLNYGGKKITLSREDFEEGCNLENEFEKDEFLSVLIMNKDIENESANFEDTDEAEQAKLNLENPENREQAEVPQTGLGQLSYKGQPVSIVENEVQDDGTILVENEEGEAMRVPVKDLEGMMKPDVPEITSEESFQPEGNVQAESIKEIPLTKAGKPDYNAMLETDPEMFASEWEKRSTPEKAKATLERQSENIGKRIETLQGKVEKETDLNKIADIEDEIADLLHRKEIVDEVIKSRYTSRVIEIENVEEAAPKVQDNTTNVKTQNEDILEFKEEIEPIGRGFFGNIYDQFRGKAKEAIHFLLQRKEGDAIGVFHREDLGDIDLVWGDEKAGLAHIIDRHIKQQNDFASLEDAIKIIDKVVVNGIPSRENADKIVLDKDGYRVIIGKQIRDEKGNIIQTKNWVITGFDRSRSKKEKTLSEKTLTTPPSDLEADGVTLPSNSVLSENKDNESVIENQEDKVENTENTPANIPRARIRHLDGKEYTGYIVKEEKGRITIKDDVSGREISAPKKRVIERSEQPNANSRLTQQVNIDKRKKVSNPIPDIKEEERTILSEKKDNGSIREGQGGEVEKVSIKQQKGNDQLKFIQFRYFDGSIYYGKIIAKKDDRFVVKSDNGRIYRIKDDRILTRYRSEEEMKEVSAEETERDISSDVRFRHDNTPEFINDRFNKELQQQIEGTLPQGHVYRLGNPNNLLRSAGIPDLSIELAASRLSLKASEVYENNHPFELSAVMNLPDAIQNPIAVFDSKTRAGSKVIMTELTDSRGKHFVVAMQTNIPKNHYGVRTLQINSIRSVYPKDNVHDIVNWINRGDLLKWADKTKLRNWLTQQRSNSADVATPVSEFNVAANIVENYENPTFLEGEISSEVDRISDELGVKVNKIKNRGELPEGIQKRMKDGRYPGLFDPRTGKVWIITDEVTDVADVQATMLHEIVGHKGIHGLFGDQLPEFCRKVLDSLKIDERAQLVKEYNGNEQLAAEEYVARFAEGYENPVMWEKVKAIVKEFFRGIGIDLKLNDNDLKYILWKAKNRLKEGDRMLETIEKTARNREIERKLWGRDIKEDSIEEINELFNRELDDLTEENADRIILSCGQPGVALLSAGLPDRRIALYGNKLLKKAKSHNYSVSDVKDLPKYIQNPIAVFKGSYDGGFAVLTEMFINGKNTLVSIDINKGEIQDLNLITSVFDKNSKGVINWIVEEKMLFVDKEKALNYLSSSALIADATNNSELSSATNIIKNFENPKIDEGAVRQREVGRNLGEKDVREDSFEEVNRLFNEELDRYENGKMSKNEVFHLGKPSGVLNSFLPSLPIVMYQRVVKKGIEKKHKVDLNAVKNMPSFLSSPIFIFKRNQNTLGILTEMKDREGKSVCVAIEMSKSMQEGKSVIEVNDVTSFHGRREGNIIHPLNRNGTLVWVDKEKGFDWISSVNPDESQEISNQDLLDVTNIIKNFENPKIDEGVVRQREVRGNLGEKDIREDSTEEVNKRFNEKLDKFEKGELGTDQVFSLGKPQSILKAAGVQDKIITLNQSVLSTHLKKHGLNVNDIKDLPMAIQRPIMVYEWGDKAKSLVVITNLQKENHRITAAIKLERSGQKLEVNEVASIHGKSMERLLSDMINPKKDNFPRDLLRYVDKEKALEWLSSMKAPLASSAISIQELSLATNIIKNFENPKLNNESEGVLFRKVPDEDFSKRHLNFAERTREELQDRMLSVKLLLDEVKRRGGKVTDYANPYIAENLATSKSKAQIENFDKNVWGPLLDTVKAFSERGKSFDDTDMYMMAKHAPERNARIKEVNNKEDGSGISDEEAKQIVEEFEKDFTKDEIDDFWNKVRAVTRFTTETQRKHGLIDKETKDYYDKMYEYYVPLRGWRESEAKEIEYLSDSRTTGAINLNKKAEGRSSIADSPLAYIANMAHSAIVVGNKNDIKRNVFEMMVLNKNPDLYQLKKVYRVNAGTQAEPIWVEQMEKPATELWMAGRVEVVTDHRNDAGRTRYQTKEQQVEVFVNGQRYIMEFNGNMGTQVANAINGMNLRRAEGLQNTIGRVTRWMSANYTSRNPAFVVTNFMRDFGYAIPAYWMKGGNAVTLMKNMPKAFAAIHNDLAGKGIDSEIQQLYNEFKENGGLTGYVHMTDIESYKKQIKREIRRSMGKKTFGDLAFRNVAMRWGASALEYLAQMSENSTRFAVYMSERQSGKSATQAAYAAKEITTNFNRKGRSSGVIGSLFAFFNATVQGSANAIDLARRSPGKFSVYCAGIIMMQYFASALCRVFGGEDEIGESNYNRLSDWVKYNNLVLPDVFGVGDGKFITIPLPHFFRALSSLGVIAGEVMNGVKTAGQGIESLFDAIAGDLTPVEIATPQFKNLNSLSRSLMPTMIKPYMEAYVYNRNFMNLPVSHSPYSVSQEGIIPQYKLATHKTNPLLVDLAKWLNEVSGGGDYTTSEISFDPETGDVGRNGWKSWGDLNPAKFEHLVEGIFGGRLTFFNNIWKTAKSVVSEGEVETVNIPVLRRLYQSPYGSSAWEKFYEVRDQVADIDAKASEFMKLGDYNNFVKVSSYKNASLVSVYKSYEKMIRRLNKAINLTKEGPVADMLKRQREDLVKDFALRMKGMEKRTLKNKVLVQ